MAENNQYGPDAYKRLELVKKQFRSNAAEQKKQKAAERNQRILSSFGQNRAMIVRLTVYAILALILFAVIITRVSEVFSK
jgi:hypothetical protein